ncbi:MAG: hypothetical protein GF315_08355 [candidate division Zixibacteria bacterium]|nr:hypothetical protein [candidate division Zixibacteria bacterium]
MNCQKATVLISGKLDGELTPEQEKDLNAHLESCPNCQKEYQELLRLKEVTSDMKFADLPDRYWAGYWNTIYNRLERGIGWVFVSVGVIILVGFFLWNIFDGFFLDNSIPLILRLGIGLAGFGALILLVSVLRERLFARKHERYDEVER